MATKTSTQDLANLVINKVESQTAYDQMVAAGQINANELYLVEGDTIPFPYTSNPAMDGTASPGSSTDYAKGDHVHPTDTSRAPLASPALTGTPTAPTAASGTSTTQIATTAFVANAISEAISGNLYNGDVEVV